MITITIPLWLTIAIIVIIVLNLVNNILSIIKWKLDEDIKVLENKIMRGVTYD